MKYSDLLDRDIKTLSTLLELMKLDGCDTKSIAVVEGFLNVTKQFREKEDEQ